MSETGLWFVQLVHMVNQSMFTSPLETPVDQIYPDVQQPRCICAAPCAFQRVGSCMQQSQWIILSGSGCCCTAERSHAAHTCPATCLHHRARAGRDSACQCLQQSDYAPVFRLLCGYACS